jgi:hypothetical protein
VGVVAHVVRAQGHELLALGQLVDVEGDLLGGLDRPLLAAIDGVLLALLGARVVEVAALAIGDVDVGLLDPRQHLLVERFLEGLGGLHDRVGVGVLGLEVRLHLRVGLVP